jgi:hypothetical protein
MYFNLIFMKVFSNLFDVVYIIFNPYPANVKNMVSS